MFDTVLTTNLLLDPDDPETLVSDLVWDSYDDVLALRYPDGIHENIGTHLERWGFVAQPGCVFVKNDPPYSGLVSRLAEMGLVAIEQTVTYGPFSVTAHEIRPIVRLEAPLRHAA